MSGFDDKSVLAAERLLKTLGGAGASMTLLSRSGVQRARTKLVIATTETAMADALYLAHKAFIQISQSFPEGDKQAGEKACKIIADCLSELLPAEDGPESGS